MLSSTEHSKVISYKFSEITIVMQSQKFLNYFGGHYYIKEDIRRLMALFSTFDKYVEPFGGAGTMLFELLDELIEAGKKIVYNDIYGELTNLLTVIAEHWEEFDIEAQKLPCSRKVFDEYRRVLDNPKEYKNNVLRALAFVYVQNNSWDGKGDEFKGKPGGWYKAEKIKELSGKIRKHIIIENLDFEECIKKYDNERTFFLIDSPYYDLDYYKRGMTPEDHARVRKVAGEIKGMVLLTYNFCEPIKEMYDGYYWKKVVASNDVEHILISNYCNRKENLSIVESLVLELKEKVGAHAEDYVHRIRDGLRAVGYEKDGIMDWMKKNLVETDVISLSTLMRHIGDEYKDKAQSERAKHKRKPAITMTAETHFKLFGMSEEAQKHIRSCKVCKEELKFS